jgi:hypothetical protein
MRLSEPKAALLAAFTILVALSGRALAEGSAADPSLQPKDWISLQANAAVAAPGETHRKWTSADEQPVLLPLPAEGWVGMGMLAGVVAYCGIRRARILGTR